jgi:hypothetical protein
VWERNKGVSWTRPVGRSLLFFKYLSSLLLHTAHSGQVNKGNCWPAESTCPRHYWMTEWLEAPLLLQVQNRKVDESTTTRHWLIYSLWFSIGVGFRAIFNQASLSDEIQSSLPVDCEKELRNLRRRKKTKKNKMDISTRDWNNGKHFLVVILWNIHSSQFFLSFGCIRTYILHMLWGSFSLDTCRRI